MMKIKFLLLLLFLSKLSYAQSRFSDTLDSGASSMNARNDLSKISEQSDQKDSLFISIKQFERLINSLEDKGNGFELFIPSLIALIVVIISTGGAIYIGNRQITTQIDNARTQLRSQEAQTQDQLNIAREQIKEASFMSLAQVRANNISQARIHWIQDLRENISQLIGSIIPINYNLKIILKFVISKENVAAQESYIKLLPEISKAKSFLYKIRLQLSKDISNTALESLFIEYEELVLKNIPAMDIGFKLDELEKSILEKSKIVLKEAWEQAKSEGNLR